jgi:hypothetical protein
VRFNLPDTLPAPISAKDSAPGATLMPGRRILIVSDAWHPQVNGVVRTLSTISDELRAMGHVVEVIGPDRFRTLPCPKYAWRCSRAAGWGG